MSLKLLDIARGLPWIKSLKGANDDDYADRLNHRHTAGLLFICALICTTFPYSFNRISCWVPAHFIGAFQKYTNDYCWISNTYYVPVNNTIPNEPLDRRKAEIGYYQWVPFILILSGFMFYLPRMLWRSMNTRSGIDLQNLVKKQTKNAVTASLELYCEPEPPSSNVVARCFQSFCCTAGKRLGNYVSVIYIMTKMLYTLNSFAQLFFFQYVLGQSGLLYGLSIWRSVFIYNSVLTDSPFFPRVTLCDLSVREVGNVHRYTVQCVLPINMLNEKVFSLLWFWLFIIFVSNVISFLRALYQYASPRSQYGFIRHQYETFYGRLSAAESQKMKRLTCEYLGRDGVLILRIIDQNSHAFIVPETINDLFSKFEQKRPNHVSMLTSTIEDDSVV